MEQKNLNRLRVIISEKNLTNKWLSEQLGGAGDSLKMGIE